VPRRHRFGIPALLITGLYVGALAVTAVIALTTGDLGALWRLTLFTGAAQGVAVTWPNTLILVVAGLPCAWALWQSLRGPLTGPAPELDRDTRRLRMGLYAAAASWACYALAPSWPWWAVALDAALMWVVVVLFQPVLGSQLEHADHARAVGVVAYGGAAAIEVIDVLNWPLPDWLPVICGLAGLIWMVLVLRAQRRSGRWQQATVRYGVAALVAPVLLTVVSLPLATDTNVYGDVASAAQVLMVIWLARSAHDLADPSAEPVPSASSPVGAEPPPAQ